MNTALSVENLQTFFTDEGQIPAVNGVSLTLARSRVAVMYTGKIVELGQTEQIFTDPKHPSIRALLAAVPDVPMNFDLGGEVADAGRLPPGCSFHPRHPRRFEPCDKVVPALRPVDGTTCHLYGARER